MGHIARPLCEEGVEVEKRDRPPPQDHDRQRHRRHRHQLGGPSSPLPPPVRGGARRMGGGSLSTRRASSPMGDIGRDGYGGGDGRQRPCHLDIQRAHRPDGQHHPCRARRR